MLAEVVVIVVVVVVEVEFGTVGIETSVSWEQLWLLCQNFTLFCHTTRRNLLAEIANNITSDAIQGCIYPFPNKYGFSKKSCLKLNYRWQLVVLQVIQIANLSISRLSLYLQFDFVPLPPKYL